MQNHEMRSILLVNRQIKDEMMNSEYKRAWNKVNQVMREEFQAFDRFIDQTTNKFKKHVKDRIEK